MASDNDVVDDTDADQVAHGDQSTGERHIISAGCGIPGRMVVVQDNGRGASKDTRAKHFAWMNDRSVKASPAHDVTTKDAVTSVKAQDAEHFDNFRFEKFRNNDGGCGGIDEWLGYDTFVSRSIAELELSKMHVRPRNVDGTIGWREASEWHRTTRNKPAPRLAGSSW